MASLIEQIAACMGRGFVRADAGFGKTHLIAEAVHQLDGPHLILTHTHAGVDSIKKKLREMQVPAQRFRVDTIAGFSLRLCLAYRGHSKWSDPDPKGEGWNHLYSTSQLLLQQAFMARILQASFRRVFVDEYQDCSEGQHYFILQLARYLPTIVLGDPLQGIFDWNGMIDWECHVRESFTPLGSLETPHRWRNVGADELGKWLVGVRSKLESDEQIDLSDAPRQFVAFKQLKASEQLREQVNCVKYFKLPQRQSLVAIHGSGFSNKAKCHYIAKQSSGVCSSIEEVEGARLRTFVAEFDAEVESGKKLERLLSFLKGSCVSGLQKIFSAGSMRGEIVKVGKSTKNAELTTLANAFIHEPSSDSLLKLIDLVRASPSVSVYAKDLWGRLRAVMLEAFSHHESDLQPAFARFQAQFRHRGRPMNSPRIVATTLLVKGLQFDHAIVLDAATMSKKDFYVGITRGSRSLTILSTERFIQPRN